MSGTVDRAFERKTGAFVVAAGGGSLWSTGYLGGHVRGAARLDAVSGTMSRLAIGIYGDLVAADDTAAYCVNIGNWVARVSVKTGLLTDTMTLAPTRAWPRAPRQTHRHRGRRRVVWISETDGTLLRIQPRLGRIVASIRACRNALAVASAREPPGSRAG